MGEPYSLSENGFSQSQRSLQGSQVADSLTAANSALGMVGSNLRQSEQDGVPNEHQSAMNASISSLIHCEEVKSESSERAAAVSEQRQTSAVSALPDLPPPVHHDTAVAKDVKVERGVTAADDGRR